MFLFFCVICRVRAQLCIDQYLRTLSFLTLIHFIRLRKCSSDSVHVHGPTALTVNVSKRSFSVASGQNKSETCTFVLWQPISLSTCLAASLFFHYGAYAKAFLATGCCRKSTVCIFGQWFCPISCANHLLIRKGT